MRLLAGDIGGTKTLLRSSVLKPDGTQQVETEERYETDAFESVPAMIGSFCARTGAPDKACLAVAGPVAEASATLTNLGWRITEHELREVSGARVLRLVNDFWAVAYGVPRLGRDDVVVLNAGQPEPRGPIGVLGAGTGLGQAMLLPAGTTWSIYPSEGGHCDFAPIGELQRDLHAYLEAELGHVSYERVVSGQGLSKIYRFLHHDGATGKKPDAEGEDVAEQASAGDPIANAALDMFVDIYAAEAGNLALKLLARGGIYLAGGIAPKHLPRIEARFMRRFVEKGRFEALMRTIPVYVITESRVGLIGAAACAAEL